MLIEPRLLSINFSQGRGGTTPDLIVDHVSEGTIGSMREWFNDPDSEVSSHYAIARKGSIEQYVDENDRAWSNGRLYKPTAAIVLSRPTTNPNRYTISIEHEGTGLDDLTDKQRAASAWLHADISQRRGIPLNRKHVIRHHEIFAKKTCPGRVDIDKIIALAVAPNLPGEHPGVVWSDYFKDYLIVTDYVSDREWRFIPLKKLTLPAAKELPAQTRLSQMPLFRA